jgi:hypothetical protein
VTDAPSGAKTSCKVFSAAGSADGNSRFMTSRAWDARDPGMVCGALSPEPLAPRMPVSTAKTTSQDPITTSRWRALKRPRRERNVDMILLEKDGCDHH